jgi:hypothetical protein
LYIGGADTREQLPGAAKPKIQEAKKLEVKQIEPKRSSRIKKTKIIHYNPRSSQKAKIKRSGITSNSIPISPSESMHT